MLHVILAVPANKEIDPSKAISRLASKLIENFELPTVIFKPLDLFKEEIVPLLEEGRMDVILSRLLAAYDKMPALQEALKYLNDKDRNEVIVVEGAARQYGFTSEYARQVNIAIAQALSARILLLGSEDQLISSTIEHLYDDRTLGGVLGWLNPDDQSEAYSSTLRGLTAQVRDNSMTPAQFSSQVLRKAIELQKRIVLPEGTEPRVIGAAIECAKNKIARCILLGRCSEIDIILSQNCWVLPDAVEIVDPETIAEEYVEPLVELRKHKGMTEEKARDLLYNDMNYLGTMMVQMGDADGLVSGAIHSTADTVRPALQIVKTVPGCHLVSSVFFMCLPEEVLVYGDCAINQNPTAEHLADIAIQSADTAKRFGFEPRVAMISYSTGTSGAGPEVEKVIQAVMMVKERRSDILIDGPLQYDAATSQRVASIKAPNSKVAGRANVFVFPDLNTGNTVYKAVQQTNQILSFGPLLQGLNKPTNDLSRGCLLSDIVYTVALTAVQAE